MPRAACPGRWVCSSWRNFENLACARSRRAPLCIGLVSANRPEPCEPGCEPCPIGKGWVKVMPRQDGALRPVFTLTGMPEKAVFRGNQSGNQRFGNHVLRTSHGVRFRFGANPFAADLALPALERGPVDIPPWSLQRPFRKSAVILQGVPARVRAPHVIPRRSSGNDG